VDQSWGSDQSFKKINHGPIKVTPSKKKKKTKGKKKTLGATQKNKKTNKKSPTTDQKKAY